MTPSSNESLGQSLTSAKPGSSPGNFDDLLLVCKDQEMTVFVESSLKSLSQVKLTTCKPTELGTQMNPEKALLLVDSAELSPEIENHCKQLPILAMGRPDTNGKIRSLLGHGLADLISHPWSSEELKFRIETQLDILHARKAMGKALDPGQERLEALAEKLVSQNLELARANRLKDEFLAVLSHELRNPINVISGFSEILLQNFDDRNLAKEAAEAIHRNAQFQMKLIQDLMDLSRGLAGKLLLDCREMEVCTILKELMPSALSAARKKNVRIFQRVQTSGLIYGDPQRISQVLWNLISNAIKFTPEWGQIEIVLRKSEGKVIFSVQDNGVGIAPEFLPEMFHQFCQQDKNITRKFGGLGLGLAIVKQITDLHHGTVTAESEGIGRGATFTVQLPALTS